MRSLNTRIIGLIVLISGYYYLNWLFLHFNFDAIILSSFFIFSTIFSYITSILLVFNNWSWKIPKKLIVGEGREPQVAILIPTWKEDIKIVRRTVLSVVNQNYPIRKMLIIVSDDAANPNIKSMVYNLRNTIEGINILYNIPEPKGSPDRKGEGKSGNLNSALALLVDYPTIGYIETRDADDLVSDKNFLRYTIAQLEQDARYAYVQTIKDAITTDGDPFANREKLFYNSLVLSKNAANTVFPCGSGLVWRRTALENIGGFPDWNLVEDFQSGAEALRRGWRGLYLPIIGALGQISPEDIPNLIKQRTTWAADSFRFMLWGEKKGLNLIQRAHFIESGLFYLMAGMFSLQAIIPMTVLLTNQQPISGNPLEYLIHIAPYLLSVFLFVLTLERDQDVKIRQIIRSFQVAFGLGPTYLITFLKTILCGANYKPKYVVTNKYTSFGFYILNVLPQLFISASLVFAIYTNIINNIQNPLSIEWTTILWGLLYLSVFTHIVKLSWFSSKAGEKFEQLFGEPLLSR
ncbi:MAG TPA: glycosyltransferase [Candidatus Dojkabacteria bacterium]|nr:glycosyltransferase [Candidatus Dojkabacteria bacterium]